MVVIKKINGKWVKVKDTVIDRGENSKSDDKQRAKIEFLSPTRYKGNSPESPVVAGETGESILSQVGDKNSKTRKEDEKNRISARFIGHDVVEDDYGHRVWIDVYDVGKYEEYIEGDKIVRTRKVKFIIKYKNTVKECADECRDAVKAIARATNYNVSINDIMAKINELREEYETTEEVPLVDYVREKYADRLAEIEKDPFGWILQRTKEIVGYDRLKLLTFLAVVSSQMERVMGMSRIHLMLVGKSGAGKSSTIKSVLRFIDSTDILISGTRLTENSLGYLGIDTFDGKVLFIEQIDRQNINYIREMMSEEKICTLVTEKVVDEDGNEHFKSHLRCTPGQAVVVTTSVADTIDVEREQIFNRFMKVYVNPESLDLENVVRSILTRQSTEVSEVDKLVFMAYLKTRPHYADITPVLDQAKKFVLSLQEYTREPLTRVTEVLRNLIIAVAIARGKTKADESDLQFVMDNFQLDVLYDGLGLTEGDVEIVKLLPDDGGMVTGEIAEKMKMSDEMTRKMLRNLEKKGIVYGYRNDDQKGKPFVWSLTPLGRKIKALISNIGDVAITRNEKGELIGTIDSKFRNVVDAGNDSGNAVRGNDTRAVSRGDEKDNRVIEAYKWLKEHGSISTAELTELFGDDIIEKLKAKDLITFNIVDGVEYVNAK